ncbi:MAG: hypothetical protein Q8942_07875 [Bacillota bacterium]|nr:hypothetical protein [Bacillota bacterium]
MNRKDIMKDLLKLEVKKTRLLLDILPDQLGRYAKDGFDSFIDTLNEVTKESIEDRPKVDKEKGGLNKVSID